jgi:hypothetical protein
LAKILKLNLWRAAQEARSAKFMLATNSEGQPGKIFVHWSVAEYTRRILTNNFNQYLRIHFQAHRSHYPSITKTGLLMSHFVSSSSPLHSRCFLPVLHFYVFSIPFIPSAQRINSELRLLSKRYSGNQHAGQSFNCI